MAEPGGTRSKRKAECLDPDPDLGYSESSKRLKTQAATPIYEDGISSTRFLSIHSIVRRHVSADKETVQKDKDLFNETQAATPIYEDGISSTRFLSIHSIVRHHVSAHKETVQKDGELINESPASTTHKQEERSPHALSDEEDRKHDKDFDGKDKDSAIETPAATTPINEPEEARSKVDLAFRSMCATIALNYYNNNYKTKFELVEALDGYLPDSSGSRIYCHFNAKEYDDSINKFFAEIHLLDLAVTTCKILDGETKVGARNRKFIYQPVDYYFGSYYFNSSLRHPISDDEEVNLKRSTRIVIRDEEYARKHKSPDYKRDRREFWTRVYQQQCKEDANLALAYYNEQNHTKYKLVEDYEIMESNPIYDIAGNFVHCFFEANDGSSSSKFFAEIPIVQDASILPSVTTCKVLVEGQTKDCGHCDFIHPVDGCQAPSAPREMSYDTDMELDQVPMNSDELRYWRCSTSPAGDTGDSYCPTSPSYEQGCSWYNPSYETTTSDLE